MTRVNHLDRSWILTWTLSLLTILGFIGLLVYSSLPTTVLASHDPTADPEDPHAAFRIVDVRDAYGRLVLEVQHFKANGDHWFYEVFCSYNLSNSFFSWVGASALQQAYPRLCDKWPSDL